LASCLNPNPPTNFSDEPELFTLAAVIVGTGLFCLYAREIADAIRDLMGGGPRPPSHPLPADDGVIVLRRRGWAKTRE
jgi:hypothetical protein